MTVLKVGYVPEHFSTPLFFAQKQGFYKKNGVEVEFLPYPSGSGHLMQSLENKTIGKLNLIAHVYKLNYFSNYEIDFYI